MASSKIFLEITISVIFLLTLIQHETEANRRDGSTLLSLLTDKAHGHKQPVIIILDRGHGNVQKNLPNLGLSSESSNEDKLTHVVHQLLGHNKPIGKPVQHKKSTSKPLSDKNRQRFRSPKLRADGKVHTEGKNTLRSPIVKKLLRISNSLRCEAKDECQDKCSNKFAGKKQIKCQLQCDVKYDCEEEEEYTDPCMDEECDDCGQGNCHGSTKGEKIVTAEPGCKRC